MMRSGCSSAGSPPPAGGQRFRFHVRKRLRHAMGSVKGSPSGWPSTETSISPGWQTGTAAGEFGCTPLIAPAVITSPSRRAWLGVARLTFKSESFHLFLASARLEFHWSRRVGQHTVLRSHRYLLTVNSSDAITGLSGGCALSAG